MRTVGQSCGPTRDVMLFRRRASAQPSGPMPVAVRTAGSWNFGPGWTHGKGTITWFNFYWASEGETAFVADDASVLLRAGQAIIHQPGTRIDGRPVERGGCYRWMTLDGADTESVLRAFGLPVGRVFDAGRCPDELFEPLYEELGEVRPEAEYRAGVSGYRLLAAAARHIQGAAPLGGHPMEALAARAVDMMEARFAEPDFNVDRLAAELDVHRSSLSRAVLATTGLPPSEYVQRLRLHFALSLLREGGLAVRTVARMTGFRDAAYLSRCVKRAWGVGPRALRQSTIG